MVLMSVSIRPVPRPIEFFTVLQVHVPSKNFIDDQSVLGFGTGVAICAEASATVENMAIRARLISRKSDMRSPFRFKEFLEGCAPQIGRFTTSSLRRQVALAWVIRRGIVPGACTRA